MTAKIIPFPTRQSEPEQGDYLLTLLDPVENDQGIVWAVRLEFAPSGQGGGEPDLTAA